MPSSPPPANRSRLKNVTLFSEEDELPSSGAHSISISQINLPKQQPRRYFDPQKLAELAASIAEHGILEPLLVRPIDHSSYELVAGERRYRAAQQVGLTEVPVIIRDINEQEAFQIALVENLQREDLNPLEETEGILQLLSLKLQKPETEVVSLLHRMQDEMKGKVPHNVMGNSEVTVVKQVFESISRMEWQSFVSNRLPLLKLPPELLQALRQGKIAYTKAQAITRVKDEQSRNVLLEEVIAQDLSLSQVKERIAAINTAQAETVHTPTIRSQIDEVLRLAKRSRVIDDPKKQKRLEKLLADLKSLITDMN